MLPKQKVIHWNQRKKVSQEVTLPPILSNKIIPTGALRLTARLLNIDQDLPHRVH
jgi:hypothetical protein